MLKLRQSALLRGAAILGCFAIQGESKQAVGNDPASPRQVAASQVVELIGFAGRVDKVLGSFATYDEAQRAATEWSQGNPNDLRLYRIREVRPGSTLGALSAKYEASKRGPLAISRGKIQQKDNATGKVTEVDDPGGVSYGTYQLASKRGIGGSSATAFVNKYYPDDFANVELGSEKFAAKWTGIVKRDPRAFQETEHQFIKETHYDPVVEALQKRLGLDVEMRSRALRDAIWSTAVQHGPPEDANGHAVAVLQGALAKWNSGANTDWSKVSDAELLKAIYAERGRIGANGKLVHFPSLKHFDRFDRELRDAFDELNNDSSPQSPALP
jgi:hypothetical protein